MTGRRRHRRPRRLSCYTFDRSVYPRFRGELCFNNRHRFSSHSADKGCKLPLAGHGYLPVPIRPTQPLTRPNRGCFPSLCPSARRPRRKWVRASARIAGHPAAPSPTKSDRRSACPTCPKTGPLFHLSTLQRLIFISSDSHLSPFTEAVSYFCRSRSQWRRNVVGGSFSRSAALRILPYRS